MAKTEGVCPLQESAFGCIRFDYPSIGPNQTKLLRVKHVGANDESKSQVHIEVYLLEPNYSDPVRSSP
jgi:hypothetical protein